MVIVEYQSIAYDCPLSACWCHQLKELNGKEVNGLELITLYYRIIKSHTKFDGYPYYDEIAEHIKDIAANNNYHTHLNLINIIDALTTWLEEIPFCYSIIASAAMEALMVYTEKFSWSDGKIFDLYDNIMVLFRDKKYLNTYYYEAKQIIIRNNVVKEFVTHVESIAKLRANSNNNITATKIMGHKNTDKIHYTVEDFYSDLPDEWKLGVLL